jgi:cyclophilin family peptidyl-prolyl cis-trans isomerase
MAIFRVVPDYVAQFGIHDNGDLYTSWNAIKVPDEPVIEKNVEGAIAFARSINETRTTQIFINLKSNSPRLDTLKYKGVTGFPVIAKITNGMDIVKQFYDGYANEPSGKQDIIQKEGNAYLKQHYPKLDYIIKAYLLK